MAQLRWSSLLLPLLALDYAPASATVGDYTNQEPLTHKFDKSACPDYANYATYPQ